MIQILYPLVFYGALPLLVGVVYWRLVYYRYPVYRYSSLLPLKSLAQQGNVRSWILFFLRVMSLLMVALALMRIRLPDTQSQIPVEGVDILLVLDSSGSMQLIDDRNDGRTRFDIARDEAISFIKKREYDPIGVVIFSGAAVTRCPLTLDKQLLEEILKQISVETIPIEGTVLSEGIIVAANRLKKSRASSRIMIVLTDGAPSYHDSDPRLAIALAKKLGIRIYTIGIGSKDGGWFHDPLFGWQQQHNNQYNEQLLQRIAVETGGKFFQASRREEMSQIYNTIDKLEKSSHEVPLFARYTEYFPYFLLAALLLLLTELFLLTFFWVRL